MLADECHLVDHYAIYNKLGIKDLFSFDINENEVARQRFNRPTGNTLCVTLNSKDLPGEIDQIFEKYRSKSNLIVWLDFTSAKRRSQFQQAVETLVKLRHGDIFRITINASRSSLDGDWKAEDADGPGEYRAEKLRSQIAEFMPSGISSIGEDELPSVLAKCMELVVSEASRRQPDLQFIPVLTTCYKDGQEMLTVTCVVVSSDAEEKWPAKLLSKWGFSSSGWDDLKRISVPVLSSREQHKLDPLIHRGAKGMLKALKFFPAKDEKASLDALNSYRQFHRYYPSFRHVED